ncbi:MAG: adenylate/guanylate cyclase domain-containing protein [Alphaproteobacteria bacterium]
MAAPVQDIVREGGGLPPDLADWIISQGLLGATAEAVFEGISKRLVEHGVPIARAYSAMRILHPLYAGFGLVWRRKEPGVKEERYGASPTRSEAWLRSPIRLLIEEDVPELRRRITGPEIGEEFPVLEEFRQEGATDYFATACRFGFDGEHADSRGIIFSWTTDRPGGFSDAEIDLLRQVVRPLALTMRVGANRRLADGLAAAYLGQDAGRRVLSGDIRRGAANTISAVLLYGDLRGFTRLADALPKDELLAMLDGYLEHMALPVEAHGGQVLKFMGDGMLGTFEIKQGEGAKERAEESIAALNAALEALGRIEAFNQGRAAAGKPVLTLDLALHLGDVLYGNVGSPSRLDFTVVGPAVNEVSRLESMCEALDRPLIISHAFKNAMPPNAPPLLPLGRYGVRSVRDPVELFTVERIPAWTPSTIEPLQFDA